MPPPTGSSTETGPLTAPGIPPAPGTITGTGTAEMTRPGAATEAGTPPAPGTTTGTTTGTSGWAGTDAGSRVHAAGACRQAPGDFGEGPDADDTLDLTLPPEVTDRCLDLLDGLFAPAPDF